MHVVALVAQKGGVGKTSIALALAIEPSAESRTVVVLDADPQASACRWRDRRQADAPVVTDVQPSRLRNAVDAAAEQGVDLVVVDTPPRSETAALKAAKVADLFVIPCRPQMLDLEAVPVALRLLALAGGHPTAVSVLNSVPPSRSPDPTSARAVRGAGVPAHARPPCRRPGPDRHRVPAPWAAPASSCTRSPGGLLMSSLSRTC